MLMPVSDPIHDSRLTIHDADRSMLLILVTDPSPVAGGR
jgi:hypothetical protein